MFERPQSGERAILVHAGPDGAPEDSERSEFAELARSAGAIIVDEIVSARKRPEPRFLRTQTWCPRKPKGFVTGVTSVFASESSSPISCFRSAATAAFSSSATLRARSC